MKKSLCAVLVLATCLWAADFWQTKPYTEWSEKEAQRVETNSPWAKQYPVSLDSGGGPNTGRAKRGGNGNGDLDSGSGTTGSGGRGNTQEVGGGMIPGGGSAITLIISWRTALPIRQAVAKEKFGAETATSADAKKMVEEEQKVYAILVSGLPGRAARGADTTKATLLENTALSVKGKDPIHPTDLQSGGNEQRSAVLFLFPKTTPLSLDDKDVEFSTRIGPIVVRQKFRLKDMLFNGKLDL
jgi:hypothetical protein